MEIIKAFENNDMQMHVTIKGTHEEPLFRATDIGAILDIVKIRNTIKDFDVTEKVARTVDTLGGPQEVTFLTEKGLYQVLFTSRKPIAKKFKDWVCEIIREIRLKGKYELEKQIKYKDEMLEYKDYQKESNILDNFDNKPIVYLSLVDINLVKFGYTNGVKQRIRDHRKKFGKKFAIDYVFESIYNREIERRIKDHEILKPKIIEKEFCNENKVELIKLDKKFTMEDLWKVVSEIKNQVENENNKDYIITMLKLEIASLKLEFQEYKEKYELVIEEKQIQLNQNRIKMVNFRCSKCNYTTGCKSHINRHIENPALECNGAKIIEVDTINKCVYCEKLYKTSHSLTKHEKMCKQKNNKV